MATSLGRSSEISQWDLPPEESAAFARVCRNYLETGKASVPGDLTRVVELSMRCQEVFRKAHKERVLEETAPRSLASKWSEANSVVIDLLSIQRNTLAAGAIFYDLTVLRNSIDAGTSATGAAARVATAVGASVIAGGALGFFAGGNIVRESLPKIAKDYERGNLEGGVVHAGDAFIGSSYATVAAGMVVGQSATFANAAAAAAAGSMLSIVAGFAMYGAIGIAAGYGLAANHLFRNELDQILEPSSRDRQKLSHALVWLQKQVRGSDKETELHKKWDQFAFRTSEACCRFVREAVTPELLDSLKAGDREAIQKAESIIQEVKRANGKQLAKHYLLMAISILGIAAFVCGSIFATGPLAPLLWAIGALLWLGIDSNWVNEKWGNFWCGKSLIPAAQIPKDPSPLPVSLDTPPPPALQPSWKQPSPWIKTAGVAAAASAAAYATGWHQTGIATLAAAGASLAMGGAAAIYRAAKRSSHTAQQFLRAG